MIDNFPTKMLVVCSTTNGIKKYFQFLCYNKNNNAIFVRRDTNEKINVSLDEDIVLKVNELNSEINKNLCNKIIEEGRLV